jgi:hypothetical protein
MGIGCHNDLTTRLFHYLFDFHVARGNDNVFEQLAQT